MTTRAIIPIYKTGSKRPKLPPIAWPWAPLLELPVGDLRNFGGGRILATDHFVLAVRLSKKHYLVVARAPGVGPVDSVINQAIGFLYAHGAVVIRANLRAPLIWFMDDRGDFSWKKCLVFFARIFLASDPTDPPWIPPMIWPVMPLGVIASAGSDHWQNVKEILEGIEAIGGMLLTQLGPALAAQARRWEFYMARMVVLSQRAGEFDPDERDLVLSCDRLLLSIVSRFQPGYEFLPITISRLL